MVFLQALLLIVVLVMIFCLNDRDIFAPTTLLMVVYLIVNFFATAAAMKWRIRFDEVAVLLLFASVMMLELGEMTPRLLQLKKGPGRNDAGIEWIGLKRKHIALLAIIAWAGCGLYSYRMYQIAREMGFSGAKFLFYVRKGLIDNDARTGYIIVIMKNLSQAIAYVCGYALLFNRVGRKTKNREYSHTLGYLIAIAPALIIYYVSSSRYIFLKFFIYLMGCYGLVAYQKTGQKIGLKRLVRLFRLTIIFGTVFVALFAFTGKSRDSFVWNSWTDKFVSYAGSSIVGLSEYVKQGMQASRYFGEETLTGLFALMDRLGINVHDGTKFLETFKLTSTLDSNIYTAVRSYIADYGIWGSIIVQYLLGIAFGAAYLHARKGRSAEATVLYSYFLFGYLYQAFTPYVLTELFSLTQIFEVIWIVLLLRLVKNNMYRMDVSVAGR